MGQPVADPDRPKLVAQRVSETVRRLLSGGGRRRRWARPPTSSSPWPAASPSHRPGRELDMPISSGERIRWRSLAMALSDLGHDAISFTGSQSGILTNDRHSGRASSRSVRSVSPMMERDRVVIVAGFRMHELQARGNDLGARRIGHHGLSWRRRFRRRSARLFRRRRRLFSRSGVVPDAC